MRYFYRVLAGLILAGWAFTIGSVVTKSDGGLPAFSAAIALTMAVSRPGV